MFERKIVPTTGTEKRFVRLPEALERYGLGRTAFRKLAEESGAIVHYGRSVLYKTEVIDRYLDGLQG